MSIRIEKPGLLTTVQDLGRYGHQKSGVVVGGAMDSIALRLANLLVGNDPNAAALELTLLGPTLRFEQGALIALCGGDFAPSIDGVPVPQWRPVYVRAGSVLTCRAAQYGCRAYLAVAGGLDVPQVLGSRSTYVRGGFGGYEGRALKAGDVLAWQTPSPSAERRSNSLSREIGEARLAGTDWYVSPELLPEYSSEPVIRVMTGREWEQFTPASRVNFFKNEFTITPQSDRMGYRLAGEPLLLEQQLELISTAVAPGTIQVPSEGQPILLLADRQTTGGYPRIAQVISVDLPLLAQLKPGQKVRFQDVSLAEAQELYLRRETVIRQFEVALKIMER